MSATITYKGTAYTKATLETKSTADLLELFNSIQNDIKGATTKRFSDRPSALKRVWMALQNATSEGDDTPVEGGETGPLPPPTAPKVKAKAEPKPKKEKQLKGRGMRFVFPTEKVIKPVRANSKRGVILALLQREGGATFDECLAATWGKDKDMTPETQVKTCYEAIRLVHYFNGYGLKQDEQGRITAHGTPTVKAKAA